ncbi:MAG: membrane protein insertion efficiency factor YidD [Candidatus Omnitrophica bacterium]|nr:membrane protein insertion efficiency factor YidD [Candidatus Omnitrophota bacterium]
MLKRASLKLIQIYQKYIRVCIPCTCRFSPSCSEYAASAISKYGFFMGALKAIRRLCRCHPFSGSGGYDPLT